MVFKTIANDLNATDLQNVSLNRLLADQVLFQILNILKRKMETQTTWSSTSAIQRISGYHLAHLVDLQLVHLVVHRVDLHVLHVGQDALRHVRQDVHQDAHQDAHLAVHVVHHLVLLHVFL